jgi:hypothetical protein
LEVVGHIGMKMAGVEDMTEVEVMTEVKGMKNGVSIHR